MEEKVILNLIACGILTDTVRLQLKMLKNEILGK